MTNLLRAELTRFLSRKIVWIGFAVAFAALVLIIIPFAFETAPPSAADRAQAEASFASAHQEWVDHHVEFETTCKAENPNQNADYCAYPEPKLSDYLSQLTFAEVGPLITQVGTGFFGLAAAIVASSLVGADFSTGAMANWLSFVPVRWRVYASKMIIALTGPTVLAAVLIAPAVLVLGLVVVSQQGAAAVTGWDTTWSMYGRGVAVIALGAIVGSTVGFLTRRTIAAVGIILGYFVGRLVFGGVFGSVPWMASVTPWLPESNALAVLMADYRYMVPVRTMTPDGVSIDYVERVLSWEHGLVYLLVAAAVLVAAALVTFQRRDVT